MKKLQTKAFSKWAKKKRLAVVDLANALDEVASGQYEASLGGYIYKKRIRFQSQGKSGSGRTIICFKKGTLALFLYGFGKSEKDSLDERETRLFKELAKGILKYTDKELQRAIETKEFIEVGE